MSDRKLASVRRISALDPIPGKDRIVLATVDGWHVIVKKDEFNVGDLCVYCEIDSVLPQRPEFEFLAKTNYRIKTMKMGGVVSQGICFPLNIVPPIHNADGTITYTDYKEGDDVTEAMGVTHYVGNLDSDPVQAPKASDKKKVPGWYKPLMRFAPMRKLWHALHPDDRTKGFPSFIAKTDEDRIQNAPYFLDDHEHPYVVTEKIDGQSGTFALVRHKSKIPFVRDRFEYIVCSRNVRLGAPDNSSYWAMSERYNIESVLRDLIEGNDWVAIQGECVGPGIQKNKYNFIQRDLYVFNLIYPSGRLGSLDAAQIIEKHGMQFVPILDSCYKLPETVDDMLKYADGKSTLSNTLREGVVVRSRDGQKSFKAVSNEFLLKWSE